MTEVEYLRSMRTMSADDVDRVTAMHDLDDFTPAERLSNDEASK